MKTDQDLAISNRFEFQGISQGQEKKIRKILNKETMKFRKPTDLGARITNFGFFFFLRKKNKNKETSVTKKLTTMVTDFKKENKNKNNNKKNNEEHEQRFFFLKY